MSRKWVDSVPGERWTQEELEQYLAAASWCLDDLAGQVESLEQRVEAEEERAVAAILAAAQDRLRIMA